MAFYGRNRPHEAFLKGSVFKFGSDKQLSFNVQKYLFIRWIIQLFDCGCDCLLFDKSRVRHMKDERKQWTYSLIKLNVYKEKFSVKTTYFTWRQWNYDILLFRNMYQCQMGKQTMGTPIHTWLTNAETKLYRLQTPATPLFRPTHYDNVGLDDYPCGTNAIVAVISYTVREKILFFSSSPYSCGIRYLRNKDGQKSLYTCQ